MKLQILSDLHVEFRNYKWDIPTIYSDLVILAGDIGCGMDGIAWMEDQQQKLGKQILFVPGNHCYYGEDINFISRLKDKGVGITILDNESITIDNTLFIGSTLWTDFMLYGNRQKALNAATMFMADYRHIRNFTALDSIKLHEKGLEFLNSELQKTGRKILITHHGMSEKAIESKWKGNECSPAFASNLEGLFYERDPLLHVHGHVHWCYRTKINNTLVMTNVLGYPFEITHFDPNLVVEI